jgi:hypothetical protein
VGLEILMFEARVTSATPDVSLGDSEARLLDVFVRTVSGLDVVQMVLVEHGFEGINIWTIIDAEPLAFEPRQPVYSAELQASHAAPRADVFFNLINQREHPGEALGWVLPAKARVAWQRAARS